MCTCNVGRLGPPLPFSPAASKGHASGLSPAAPSPLSSRHHSPEQAPPLPGRFQRLAGRKNRTTGRPQQPGSPQRRPGPGRQCGPHFTQTALLVLSAAARDAGLRRGRSAGDAPALASIRHPTRSDRPLRRQPTAEPAASQRADLAGCSRRRSVRGAQKDGGRKVRYEKEP